MTAISGAFCNAQQMEGPECLDPQALAGYLPACAGSLGLLPLVAADSREQEEPWCLVTYLSGSEFCFLGQDLEDGFQVGVSSLAADLGSLLISPILVCRGTKLGGWEWGRAADVTAVSSVTKIRTEWHHWLNFKRRTFI